MRNFFIFTVIILLVTFTFSCQKRETDTEAPTPEIGASAPDFTLNDINGATVSLSQNKGKVVMVEFWATWCPPCKEMTPGLISLYERYKNKGFVLFALVSDDEGSAAVGSFVKEYGIAYPVLAADRGTIRKYGVSGIPASFLIDKEGKIAYKHAGNTPGIMDELESEIKKLL